MSLHEHSGKLLYNLARPFIFLWLRPSNVRVRVLVTNDANEILLVRSWFGRQLWSAPGGGIGWGEELRAAAARETREETGIIITMSQLKDLGPLDALSTEIRSTLLGFATTANGTPKIKNLIHRLEILDVQWFPLDKLPTNHSAVVDELLAKTGHI
ncbi:MAG TPA: NUDIX hydrolase [Candidatus Saccharimonadales bacterium]|jgi:8-oxo-dGTP pyrophosphatase MutT (NUDIX family)|nr:NUDIX hydrolase [Candidatus Saccharimonadales bacterium]